MSKPGRIKRSKPIKDPKAKFILFCEGEKTEPEYFRALKRKCVGTLVEIETHKGAGTPINIADKAYNFAKNKRLLKKNRRHKNSFEKYDRVWAVFDRDDHERYSEAVSQCEKNGIGVARSNPCFELWLILHETDYDKPCGHKEVQKKLEELRPEYNRKNKKMNCDEIIDQVTCAEERSEKQLERRNKEDNPFGPPSTTVGQLTREIREADKRSRRN